MSKGQKSHIIFILVCLFLNISRGIIAQTNKLSIKEVINNPASIGSNWVSLEKGYINEAILKLISIEFNEDIINGYTESIKNPRTNQYVKINYYQTQTPEKAIKVLNYLSEKNTSKNYTLTSKGNIVFVIFNSNVQTIAKIINKINSLNSETLKQPIKID